MSILDKNNFTVEDINQLIQSKLEESINIEFKSAKALSFEHQVKKEISKDISAFANSDGGLVFYGINEENHVAASTSFIDGNTFTKEWLENIIISNIQNRITDLKIFPIRFNDDISKTIYVVKIPVSENAPHINADKKYYRRYNFQSIPMEEYEIRNLYLKVRESQVLMHSVVIKPKEEDDEWFDFYLEMQITNEGTYVAEKYKVSCNIYDAIGISLNYEPNKNYTFTNDLGTGIRISTNEMTPLFPQEKLNALSFTLRIPQDRFYDIVETLKCKFLIFNSTEFSEDDFNLSDMIIKVKEKYYNASR